MVDKVELASSAYTLLLRERYTRPGWGASGYSHADDVIKFAWSIAGHSFLDYGCGRGTLKAHLGPKWDVREYDPGVEGKDALPEPADIVVATDVLEHIEPDRLSNVLQHIRGLARLGVFLNISLKPAREVLADGRNAHLIVKPHTWWLKTLTDHGMKPSYWTMRKGLLAWVVKRTGPTLEQGSDWSQKKITMNT